MVKTFTAIAALALCLSLPAGSAGAAQKSAQVAPANQAHNTDVSSQRRRFVHRRYVRRYHYVRPYAAPYRYYGYGGYPYGYRYYRPGPFIGFGIGPFGFGIW